MRANSQSCEIGKVGTGLPALARLLDEPRDSPMRREKHDCVIRDGSRHAAVVQKEDAQRAVRGRDRQERRAEQRDGGNSEFLASSMLAECRINRSAASAVPMRIWAAR
jgi:hypothetical protein